MPELGTSASFEPKRVHGTNYTPSIARGFVADLGLLPWVPGARMPANGGGFFRADHCQQEIRALAAHGINSIRIVGSFWGWLADRDAYLDCLRQLARICAQNGVTITFALWNSTPWGHGVARSPFVDVLYGLPGRPGRRIPQLLSWLFDRGNEFSQLRRQLGSTHAIPPDEEDITQYPSPGPAELWDFGGHTAWNAIPGLRFLDLVTEYMVEICKFFDLDPTRQALGSIDLYNEPDALFPDFRGATPPLRIAAVFSFIQYAYFIVRSILPQALCTVGWAGVVLPDGTLNYNQHLDTYGVFLDYYSFHSYADALNFPQVLSDVQRLMPHPNVPIVCSEFWKSDFRGHLKSHTQALAGNGIGGQMWGFLQHNAYLFNGRDIDGVLAPDPALSIFDSSQIRFTVLNQADLDAVHEWSRT